MFDVTKELAYLTNMFKQANDDYSKLKNDLDEVKKSIDDINHFIELGSNLGVVEGFKTYRKLRKLLRKRREILNKRGEISVFLESFKMNNPIVADKKMDDHNKAVLDVKDKLHSENRVYHVKSLVEDYGKTIVKEHDEIILDFN